MWLIAAAGGDRARRAAVEAADAQVQHVGVAGVAGERREAARGVTVLLGDRDVVVRIAVPVLLRVERVARRVARSCPRRRSASRRACRARSTCGCSAATGLL